MFEKRYFHAATSKQLRTGYTTGACAAASAKGAALMLLRQVLVNEVDINLPAGGSAIFQLHGQNFTTDAASCFVVKDAGDDPDVTNGAELHALVSISPDIDDNLSSDRKSTNSSKLVNMSLEGEGDILITGGSGIGKVTKPGLALPPGEWAINPVPYQMIEESVRSVLTLNHSQLNLHIKISIPDGEQRAKKTLNSRLGIIGGLSILGTTGIVRPISAKAWTDTIDAALDVARACGCQNVVMSTGRSSELAAQQHFKNSTPQSSHITAPPLMSGGVGGGDLAEESCIMIGDHIGYAMQACARRGFMQPILACQFAKLLKIACGHPNTHAAASTLDLATLHKWAEEADIDADIIAIIKNANTAREIAVSGGFDTDLIQLVASRAVNAAALHAPGMVAQILLCGYDGSIVEF